MTTPDAATEALAEAFAEFSDELDWFQEDKTVREAALAWAVEIIELVKRRGYVIRKARKSR